MTVTNAVLLPTPGEDGLVLVGGRDYKGVYPGNPLDKIFEMSCDTNKCRWSERNQTLSVPRSYHIAFYIPDEMTNCQ